MLRRVHFQLVTILIVLAITTLSVQRTYAANIPVTTATDEDINNLDCSFREAIIAANSNTDYNGCPAGAGVSDTIDLSGFASYTLTAVLPSINTVMTIDGGGATITASASGFRAFSIFSGGTLTLQNITFTGFNSTGNGGIVTLIAGSVVLNSGTVFSSNTAARGTGIFADTSGTVNITVNSGASITDNVATAVTSGGGAGIFCATTGTGTCTILIDGGSITDNSTIGLGNNGGGIFIADTVSLTLQNGALLQGNSANSSGGGISAQDSTTSVIIDASTIDNNTAAFGGGIAPSFGAVVTVRNQSIISNNDATNRGGGIFSSGSVTINDSVVTGNTSFGGAGIHNNGGSLTVENGSEITLNINSASSGGGGGIYNGGTLIVDNSSITQNSDPAAGGGIYNSGTFTLRNDSQVNNNSTGGDGGGIYSGASVANATVTNAQIIGNTAGDDGGGIFNTTSSRMTVTGSRIELNNATDQGDAYRADTVDTTDSITDSCIVANLDTVSPRRYAVSDIGGGVMTATNNWWGTAWGPLIIDLDPTQTNATIGSSVSNGDSINGFGTNRVNVALSDNGTFSTAPTGTWKTTAPVGCMVCTGVSSVGHSRVCS